MIYQINFKLEKIPSYNVFEKWHWAKKMKFKKEIVRNIFYLLKEIQCPRFNKIKVDYQIRLSSKHQRDTDNYEYLKKLINDGIKIICLPMKYKMKKGNIIDFDYKDDAEHLKQGEFSIIIGNKKNEIEVRIEPL